MRYLLVTLVIVPLTAILTAGATVYVLGQPWRAPAGSAGAVPEMVVAPESSPAAAGDASTLLALASWLETQTAPPPQANEAETRTPVAPALVDPTPTVDPGVVDDVEPETPDDGAGPYAAPVASATALPAPETFSGNAPAPAPAPAPMKDAPTAPAVALTPIDYMKLTEDIEHLSTALERFNRKLLAVLGRPPGDPGVDSTEETSE